MERTTFLGHYRICVDRGGAPREIGRTGATITYKAADDRTGETVALKLIPIASVDPAAREQFEKEARAAERLNHINVAKILDFGRDEDHFVYAFEYMYGETLDAWVEEHGPMPADAVLRVAAQVVSALSAARVHRLTHGAIQPSNLMIIPGPTPEGGWPFVKLMNFGLAGLKIDSDGGAKREKGSPVASQFASPEQSKHGTVDFRSEIYSLGATMYFLLTGAAPSAELRRQQLRVFPKPLRSLLAQMLRNNPDKRPQDPVMLAEMIRECLVRIERRQALADRFGIPLAAVIPRKSGTPSTPLAQVLRGILVFAALLLAAAVLGAFLLPADINPFRQRTAAKQVIGVPIGVPETSPSEPPQAINTTPVVANQPATNAAASTVSNQASTPGLDQGQISNSNFVAAATPATPPDASSNTPATAPENSTQLQDNSSAQANVASQSATANQSTSASKKKSVASISKRSHLAQNSRYGQPRFRTGSMRARFVGITSDGRLIMRLPSGRTVIATPGSEGADELVPRRHRRVFTERDDMFAPPPRSAPDYFPDD